jgi:DNA-binding NtrC family response regulator
MVIEPLQPGEVNVLASEADWAWPEALREIFRPRGVNLLVAERAGDFVNILRQRRVHTTIVDMDSPAGGLSTIKIIRMDYPLMPCIILASEAPAQMLSEALRLDVFSVIGKPVDLQVLLQQLNRLFVKRYNSHIFGKMDSRSRGNDAIM